MRRWLTLLVLMAACGASSDPYVRYTQLVETMRLHTVLSPDQARARADLVCGTEPRDRHDQAIVEAYCPA